ncbi:MAG: EF-hand domain-containing protein [Desulfuromonadales bacterium]
MSSIESTGIGGTQRPGPRDLFGRVDSDRSGGVSPAELQKLSDRIQEKTGMTIDVGNEAFKGYDRDGSGSLSGEELRTVLDNSGFGPPRGMQGMAPPPPPPQQATGSYSENLPDSGQNVLTTLVSRLQDLLDTLKSGMEAGPQGLPPGSPPTDIFGKVDTDRNGSLSKDELEALAENLRRAAGQSLDVSAEAIKALDRNGDGELSPDEIDLRKTLSLKSADLSGDTTSNKLKMPLDRSWQQEQQTVSPAVTQQKESVQGNKYDRSASLLEQMKEVQNLLDILTKYTGSRSSVSDSIIRVAS